MSRAVKKFISYLFIVFVMSVFMAIYVVQMTSVQGSSMEPELKDGQRILVNKIIYRSQEPKRYDVIVFRYLYKDSEYYCKRIIGLPGETVQIMDGSVYIDGEKLEEPFERVYIQNAKRAGEPVVLGEDEYFVLGDNRNFSSDSREPDIGNVKRVQILGKAFAKLWPFERIVHE